MQLWDAVKKANKTPDPRQKVLRQSYSVPRKYIVARIVNFCNREKRLLPEKFETAARAANTDDGSTGICLPEHIATCERPISRNLHIASGGAIHRCLKCFWGSAQRYVFVARFFMCRSL